MTIRTITLAVALILSAMAAHAEIVEIDVPGSTERILIDLPDGWTEAYNKSSGTQTIIEYLPKGQSLDNWEEMITVTTLRTSSPLEEGTAEAVAKLVVTTFDASFCKAKFDTPTIVNGPRNNFPAAVFQLNCFVKPEAKTGTPGVHVREFEAVGGIVIQGRDGIYQVQRAWHTDEFNLDGISTSAEQVVARLVAANDAIHDFSVAAVTPCDTTKNNRPCTAPPITAR